MITHWDPDLYPERPIPLIQELVIYLLIHGEVWLKEVDLFLNERIRRTLSNESERIAFQSLVDTNRIKVLVPDADAPLDPDAARKFPLLTTAKWRDNRKPLKSQPWRLTPDIENYCSLIDAIVGIAGRRRRNPWARNICRPRLAPSRETNEFASKLRDVLTQPDRAWIRRRAFAGISLHMAERFVGFCENLDKALAFLRDAQVTPNATDGFYRSLVYQCADEFARQTCPTREDRETWPKP